MSAPQSDPRHEQLQARLQSIASDLACPLSTQQCVLLLRYLELIQRWNKVYNLTAVRDPDEMLCLHLADSHPAAGLLPALGSAERVGEASVCHCAPCPRGRPNARRPRIRAPPLRPALTPSFATP
ncbi:MAG: RsmG family class I SAM-dependent methyltransferase [Deltaproteobacteria bacterium]